MDIVNRSSLPGQLHHISFAQRHTRITGQRSLAEMYANDDLSEVEESAAKNQSALQFESVFMAYEFWYHTPSWFIW